MPLLLLLLLPLLLLVMPAAAVAATVPCSLGHQYPKRFPSPKQRSWKMQFRVEEMDLESTQALGFPP